MPGFVFYILRSIPEIKHPSGFNDKYERVKDFGIYPLLYIDGLPPNPHYDVTHRVRKILKEKDVPPEMVSQFMVSKTTIMQYSNSNVPWHFIADKIVRYRFPIEELEKRLPKIDNTGKNEVFFLEQSNQGKALLAHMAAPDIERVEFLQYVLDKLAKKSQNNLLDVDFDSLYDYVYDCYELYIWYGTKSAIERLHLMIENLYRAVVDKVSREILGLHQQSLALILSNRMTEFIKTYEG